MTNILVVDDEEDLVWAVRRTLISEGYEVCTASDGAGALILAHRNRPDLIILDIVMPHLDGLQVCHTLRRDPDLAAVPILFLTGRDAVEDRIRGLDEGGDDYLVKPFHLGELKARVRALLRRGHPVIIPEAALDVRKTMLNVGAISLDQGTCRVMIGERSAQLTPAEFELLQYLMHHPNEVFSSQHLLQHVWGYAPETAEPGLVRWHVMNLRAKIEADPNHPVLLRTVPRHGYILTV